MKPSRRGIRIPRRTPVTPAELARIRQAAPEMGFDRQALATHLAIPYHRLDNIITREISAWWRESKQAFDATNGPESKPSRRFADVLRVKPPQFADPIPYGKPKASKWQRSVWYGDSHEPFVDPKAMAAVRGVIRDVDPHLVGHLGDLTDCWSISRFSKDPSRTTSLQDDLDTSAAHLHQTAQVAPNARRVLLEGNHEDRLRKLIWDLDGAARELPRLRVFQNAMTWPVLLGLKDIGWEFVPYRQQPLVGLLSKLVLKHGTVVRKWSGWSAKGEWERHAKGGISGHTHRLGAFYHRDLNGSHVWHEAGCTCLLEPEYVQQPDWQHACLVVIHNEERFHVEPVYIQDGKALWRGKEFAA